MEIEKKYLKFEMGMSGTGLSTQTWELDVNEHSDSDVRGLVGVIVNGLLYTEEDRENSERYLKVIGERGSVQWASKNVQSVNPDVLTFDIPKPFIKKGE